MYNTILHGMDVEQSNVDVDMDKDIHFSTISVLSLLTRFSILAAKAPGNRKQRTENRKQKTEN